MLLTLLGEIERSVKFALNMYNDLSVTPARAAASRAISDADVSSNGIATQTKRPKLAMVMIDCWVAVPRLFGSQLTSVGRRRRVPEGSGSRGLETSEKALDWGERKSSDDWLEDGY